MKRVIEIDEKTYTMALHSGRNASKGHVLPTERKLIERIVVSKSLNEVLDKIRTEIDGAYENLDGYDPDSLGALISKVDEIIDKYKESEDKE